MSKLLCYLALFAATFTTNAWSCSNSEQQLTGFALQVAKDDGHKHPCLLVGVIKVESEAGTASTYRVVKHGSGKQVSTFYGAGQLTIGAAKATMKRFPDLWGDFNTRTEEELKARLILDDRFNVRVASKYLLIMGVNRNPDKGVTAYNVGLGGVELVNYYTHAYNLKVKRAAGKED